MAFIDTVKQVHAAVEREHRVLASALVATRKPRTFSLQALRHLKRALEDLHMEEFAYRRRRAERHRARVNAQEAE